MDTPEQPSEPAAEAPSLQQLANLPATGVPLASATPPPTVFFWGFVLMVCLLSGGLSAYAGGLVSLLYQLPRLLRVHPYGLPLPGLDSLGVIAGATAGVLAAALWARRWWRVRSTSSITTGLGAKWGAELGMVASVFIHLIVGPADGLIDGHSIQWIRLLAMAGIWGLPFGAMGGGVLGMICGAGAREAER